MFSLSSQTGWLGLSGFTLPLLQKWNFTFIPTVKTFFTLSINLISRGMIKAGGCYFVFGLSSRWGNRTLLASMSRK